jgi:hypothetical protein
MLCRRRFIAAFVMAAAGAASVRADVPYTVTVPVEPGRSNTARLIVPAMLHPEVAVSESLAAQPVHPYKFQMQIAGQSTWIDARHRLDGEHGLDDNHSIVQAQRLYRNLTGMPSPQAQPAIILPTVHNTARLIVPAPTHPAAGPSALPLPQPRTIMNRPAPMIPTVPKALPAPGKQLAQR